MTISLREQFLLDPDVTFLNHGSFGATPRPVFEAYQSWQRHLERQPVQFLGTDIYPLLAAARARLGAFLNADPDDLAFVTNATTGVNIVARSLALHPGDEILTTDHEYGACVNAWQAVCQKTGAKLVVRPIDLPVSSADAIVEQFWADVTPRTKLIFISHITSVTALTLPVAAICARARAAGILTVVDGAHAPGQLALDLAAVDADFYTGNLHKWVCAPKGAAFLYTRRRLQSLIEPLVVSWGWGPNPQNPSGSPYLDVLQWSGTADPSAYLTVPAALDFLDAHDWPSVRIRCHTLAQQWLHRVCELTGSVPPYPDDAGFYQQMALAPLPPLDDAQAFKRRFYERHRVEIPVTEWRGRAYMRVSVQGYNTQDDIDRCIDALQMDLSTLTADR
ncbi:MAG: aminotransferase class V-fold PLP-dependent enzyme [Anaerolineae bacterium]|nr:aminotransferase class V-fold PLP-dependent enzyme [Anaerolineae bacterium]